MQGGFLEVHLRELLLMDIPLFFYYLCSCSAVFRALRLHGGGADVTQYCCYDSIVVKLYLITFLLCQAYYVPLLKQMQYQVKN